MTTDDYTGPSPIPRAILNKMERDERRCEGYWKDHSVDGVIVGQSWRCEECDATSPEECALASETDDTLHNANRSAER